MDRKKKERFLNSAQDERVCKPVRGCLASHFASSRMKGELIPMELPTCLLKNQIQRNNIEKKNNNYEQDEWVSETVLGMCRHSASSRVEGAVIWEDKKIKEKTYVLLNYQLF